MVLPIYTVLIKLDRKLIEAAQDLGAPTHLVFRRVIFPLSIPGVISGITMVFVPSVSTFVISQMLGSGKNLLVGDLIDLQFMGGAYNPHLGSAIALVMIIACLFSTLDNVVTFSNAHGTIAVQTWPRLFLAASGLVAGLIFDLAERRYMGLVMLGVTVLSTISILAVEAGADPNLGLVVFYLSSGFFVTFFTATFTQLAPHMHAPALWAGMGRAANNVCAFTTSSISLALVTSGNVALIMIIALVLLVAACVAFVAAGLFRLPQTEQEREHQQLAEEALAAPTIEEQRQTFITDHGLTPREVDVLVVVTQDERPLKQVAEELGISMRMVQRHLSSIYQKTDTQTRAGLTKAFPSA